MLQTYRITTVNINTIQSKTKIAALQQFLYDSCTDIALLQEVLLPQIDIPGFIAIVNYAPEMTTGTAILVREGIPVTSVERLESGRGIGVNIQGVTLVNLYAPSGSSRSVERSDFFKNDIIYLLRKDPRDLIIGGDFNSVLNRKDQMPNFNFSKELKKLVSDLKLHDAWELKYPTLVKFTYITHTSSSRIDRIYVSDSLITNVSTVETIPAIFSDHSAVIACINLTPQPCRRFRSQWNLNTSLLQDSDLEDALTDAWHLCLRSIANFPSVMEWWVRRAKPKLRKVLISFSIERKKQVKDTMEFYYSVLRDLYNQEDAVTARLKDIKKIKAKLISLKRQELEGLKIKSKVKSVSDEESAALYHLMKHARNRRKTFMEEIKCEDGRIITMQKDIVNEIHRYFEDMYTAGHTNEDDCGELFSNFTSAITLDDNDTIVSELSKDDVLEIVRNSPTKKSAGPDGLPIEFYRRYWNLIGDKITVIVNEVLQGKTVPAEFKECNIVLIPKKRGCKQISNFRPISLLNSDYKIVTRALHKSIIPLTAKIIGRYQTCAHKRSIFQTAAQYRDIIAVTCTSNIKCGLLFIDFHKAFDVVDHGYLLETMRRMGFSQSNLDVIKNVAFGLTAKISVNNQLTKPIQIRRGIPQGSPLSMILFVMSLEPFLQRVQTALTGLTISGQKTVVGAYADDVGLVIREAGDITKLHTELKRYCSVSGAEINTAKSKFLNIKGFEDIHIEWAKLTTEHKTLGIKLTASILQMIAVNWRDVSVKVKGSLFDNMFRNIDQFQRVRYLNVYVLSKAFYTAQILPVPKLVAKNIMAALTNFLWKGEIFRVGVKAVTLDPRNGGMGLTDISNKATALFIKRTTAIIEEHPHSITAKLFDAVRPASMEPPVNIQTINFQLKHVRDYYLEKSYLSRKLRNSSAITTRAILEDRRKHEGKNKIEKKHSGVVWNIVWENISSTVLSTDVKSAWYKVVNGVITTNSRLHAIGKCNSDLCCNCQLIDTLQHRYTCGNRIHCWNWIKEKIIIVTRHAAKDITTAVLDKPDIKFFPQAKNNTVIWLLGKYISYVFNKLGSDSIIDFKVYMENEYEKMCKYQNHKKIFGNMLHIAFGRKGIG